MSGEPDPPYPMSTLSRNCRGFGSPRTVRELIGLVASQQPKFIFLSETKSMSASVERLRVRLGFKGNFTVDRVGMGGGLAFLWREKEMASLIGFSGNHIDVVVSLPDKRPWRLTCFYGFPER